DSEQSKKLIGEFAARYENLLSDLTRRHPEEPQFQLALARSLAARGKTALAAKKQAEALAPLLQARDILAPLLTAQAKLDLKDTELVDFYLSLANACLASDRAGDAAGAIAEALKQLSTGAARDTLADQVIA